MVNGYPKSWSSALRPFKLAALACLAALASAPAVPAINDDVHFKALGMVIVWGADGGSAAPVVSDFILDTGSGNSAATSGDTDLIAGDVNTVVTGSLIRTHDAVHSVTGTMPFLINNTTGGTVDTDTNADGILTDADAFTAFGLTGATNETVNTTRTRSSFYVASNVPFAIDAQATSPNAGLSGLLLRVVFMEIATALTGDDGLPFGAAARHPHSSGPSGGSDPIRTLFTLRTPDRVFEGNQSTAAQPGSIADQSVRFDITYTINAINLRGYDLSLGTFDFEVDMVYTVYVP